MSLKAITYPTAMLSMALLTASVTSRAATRAAAPPAPIAPMSAQEARATVDKYCIGCHNDRTKAGDLILKDVPMDTLSPRAEAWEKVIRKLRIGAMPPPGLPKPDDTVRASLVATLEQGLDREAAASPNPGRHVVHRLNRTEYTNVVRDLLAVSIDNLDLLPPDDSGYGFDNVADVLSMSPGLLDRYLLAARKIARIAIGDPTMRPAVDTYRLPYLTLVQDDRISDELPAGTRGGVLVRHQFPVDGEYVIKLRLQRHAQALGNRIRGLAESSQIDVRLDGQQVQTFHVGGKPQTPGYARAGDKEADADLQVRLPVTAGLHEVGIAFLNTTNVIEGVGPARIPPASDGYASVTDTTQAMGKILTSLDSVDIGGPFNGHASDASPSRQAIFVCHPTGTRDELPCARRILGALARRAYRRPVTPADVQALTDVYARGRARGSFDSGIQWALERLLTDPDFLLRVERDPAGAKSGAAYRISDVALASRLSFFLWSTIPDEELLDLAIKNRLHETPVLAQQVTRMLHDPRANALVTNFFGQWLTLRTMATQKPDAREFPDFDENLRRAFQQETELFLEAQFTEDRPVMELLTANYTFVNERLARHYGIPYVRGSHFRRVTYPDDRRAGILGQGSILTVTSYAHRTSPVLRGAWVLRNILGVPPPPPPANVPPFPENDGKSAPRTVREKMEQHRRNPVCAACHGQMDPIGFAFENFDAIGRWRTMDANAPIDASGTFPGGGVKFSGPKEFRQGIMGFRELFLSTLSQKLLTYALGRGVEAYDMPAVRQILRNAASHDMRWSALVLAIVQSQPFQMRRAES